MDEAPDDGATGPDAPPPRPSGGDRSDEAPSSSGRARRLVDRGRQQATTVAGDLERRVPRAAIVRDLLAAYRRANAAALAGLLAYRMFLWLLPLALVLMAVAGLVADAGVDVRGAAADELGLGGSLADSIRQSLEDTRSSRWQLAWVALSGLLLTTSGLLKALHLAHAVSWDLPGRKVARRASLMARIVGAAPLVVIIVLGSSALRRAGPLGGIAGTAVTTAIVGTILLGLTVALPRRTDELRWLVAGPAVGAVASIGLQAFAAYYLPGRLSDLSATYGAVGVSVAVLTYLLILGQILVLSPLVNATVFDRWGPGSGTVLDGSLPTEGAGSEP